MDKVAITAWRDVVVEHFSALGIKLAAFLPSLVGAVLILLVGWGVSWLLGIIARRILRGLGLDRLGTRHRVAERVGLQRGLSDALGRLVFWSFMIVFALASVHTLGVGAVTATIERLMGYLPDLIGAALTALLGILLARLVGSITTSAAMAAGVGSAPRLGFLVQGLGLALVTAMTVEQLGLKTNILVIPLTAVVAALSLAGGLAIALGARPVITHILAGHFLKQSLPRDHFVEIDGERGIVERIGATDTLLKNGDKRWSVPNGQLLERVVVR